MRAVQEALRDWCADRARRTDNELAGLEAVGRTRALTDAESRRLATLLHTQDARARTAHRKARARRHAAKVSAA